MRHGISLDQMSPQRDQHLADNTFAGCDSACQPDFKQWLTLRKTLTAEDAETAKKEESRKLELIFSADSAYSAVKDFSVPVSAWPRALYLPSA